MFFQSYWRFAEAEKPISIRPRLISPSASDSLQTHAGAHTRWLGNKRKIHAISQSNERKLNFNHDRKFNCFIHSCACMPCCHQVHGLLPASQQRHDHLREERQLLWSAPHAEACQRVAWQQLHCRGAHRSGETRLLVVSGKMMLLLPLLLLLLMLRFNSGWTDWWFRYFLCFPLISITLLWRADCYDLVCKLSGYSLGSGLFYWALCELGYPVQMWKGGSPPWFLFCWFCYQVLLLLLLFLLSAHLDFEL